MFKELLAEIKWAFTGKGLRPVSRTGSVEDWIGRTFYSPTVDRFFHVRAAVPGGFSCGPFAPFYQDAGTCQGAQVLSVDFIRGCEMVTAIDKCRHAVLDPGIKAWRVASYRY